MITNLFFVKADADITQDMRDACKGVGRLDKDGIDRLMALPEDVTIENVPTILENETFLTNAEKNTELLKAKWDISDQLP